MTMPGPLAAILTKVLDGRQLCDMTPDERDKALSQATSIYKDRQYLARVHYCDVCGNWASQDGSKPHRTTCHRFIMRWPLKPRAPASASIDRQLDRD